jgi:starch synthase
MPKELDVLFVASEAVPFAKTGGLADVAGALPKALSELGHRVCVFLPKYGSIDEKKFQMSAVPEARELYVPIGFKSEKSAIKSTVIPNTQVKVYLLESSKYFEREDLYVDPKTKNDYTDNDERFIFFCRGILKGLRRMGWHPDIIHCNDWHSGLIPAYLKTIYMKDGFFKDTKTLFTIHNLAYQGRFPAASFAKTNLPPEVFSPEGVEFYGDLNFMKAGLYYANAISTVSEKYAEEIRTLDEYGYRMNGLLEKRKSVLYGILNGVDYNIWNPAVDNKIAQKFDARSLSKKAENKKALLARYDLTYKEGVPVIGVISRLADQKGFDLIGETMADMLSLDIQFVLLGTGEKKYHELFQSVQKKYPEKVGVFLGFNDELAHLVEAGSDMFLMPSRYEPCGLNQMYSLKYGTVPIVRATGGLADTIHEFDPSAGTGNGFVFVPYDGKELLKAVSRAVVTYKNQSFWKKIMKNGMSQDFSWKVSAKKYADLYARLLKKQTISNS